MVSSFVTRRDAEYERDDGRHAVGDISTIERVDPLAPTGGEAIVTPGNVEHIASVLADPARAWRIEPIGRKVAAAHRRGIDLPDNPDDATINGQLEQLMGSDDMVAGLWLKRAATAAEAVALIKTSRGPATGFLVSDDLLLTNWHVFPSLESARDPQARAVFRYEENEAGQIRSSVSVRLDPDRFFVSGDRDLDFAVVAVAALPNGRPAGAKFGRIRLNPQQGKVLLGKPLNIVQHPGGNPRKLAFRQNLLLKVDPTRLIYQTDTMPGSSGSPVFNDEWELVGLHYRAEQTRDTQGELIDINGNPVSSQTPDHLRHWIANAGIRVSSIVAHLAGLSLSTDQAALLAQVLQQD
ncbi:trypsin-like serine peptidase [Nocardia fluminea]|uniref:trypsin-like serine peptidase n=1 Tax=Nocardia fluminea TaxID=134984 RepID=UPI003652B393